MPRWRPGLNGGAACRSDRPAERRRSGGSEPILIRWRRGSRRSLALPGPNPRVPRRHFFLTGPTRVLLLHHAPREAHRMAIDLETDSSLTHADYKPIAAQARRLDISPN